MPEQSLHVAVIIASTREGRFAERPGNWFAKQVSQRDDMTLDLIDLAKLDLPSRLGGARTPAVQELLDRLDRADMFVVVTTEYNHGYPASLKQAIDLSGSQWRAKPVGFVSYGGLAGGLRAVEQLRQVFAEMHAVTVRDTVSFHSVRERFDENGEPKDKEGTGKAAQFMLDELAWWAAALKEAKAKAPYPVQ